MHRPDSAATRPVPPHQVAPTSPKHEYWRQDPGAGRQTAINRFRDRFEAGERLAAALQKYRRTGTLVLGMARGGVEVASAVARSLELPIGVLVVLKLGAPQNPELAIGAVTETGTIWLDQAMVRATGATEEFVRTEVEEQMAVARNRAQAYGARASLDAVRGQVAIVVDDGIATGASAIAAVRSARDLGASSVVLAVPVASHQAVLALAPMVDSLAVLYQPDPFIAVGLYYDRFDQVSDTEVIRALGMGRDG